MKTLQVIAIAGLLALAPACGKGGDAGGEAKPEAAPAAEAKADKADEAPAKGADSLSAEEILKIGERIYKTQGGNTCNDCHGAEGHSGRLQQAAPGKRVPGILRGHAFLGNSWAA